MVPACSHNPSRRAYYSIWGHLHLAAPHISNYFRMERFSRYVAQLQLCQLFRLFVLQAPDTPLPKIDFVPVFLIYDHATSRHINFTSGTSLDRSSSPLLFGLLGCGTLPAKPIRKVPRTVFRRFSWVSSHPPPPHGWSSSLGR